MKELGDFVSSWLKTQGQKARAYAHTPGGQAFLIALLALVVLLLIWWQASQWYQARLLAEAQAQTAHETFLRANALSLAINQRFAQLQGLSAFAHAEATDSEFEIHFETFAAGLYDNSQGVRDLAIAPAGIIQYVYPPDENKSVIGYDPLKDSRPEVRADTQRAIDSGNIVVSGPVELIQGGMGLIARQAVYQNDEFWGLVNVVLDMPSLLADAGLADADETDFALRDDTGRTFYGAKAVFNQDPIIRRIELPEGAWELAAVPVGGWMDTIRSRLLVFQGGGLLIVFLVAGLVHLSINRQASLAAAVEQRTQEISNINQQLEQRVASRTRELAALYDVTAVASASLDLDQVMRESLARILEVMRCEIGSVHLLDKSEALLNLAAWQGTPEDIIPEIQTLPLGSGVAGRVIAHSGPLIVPAIEAEPTAVPSASRLLAGQAYVGAPMRAKGKVVGVLSVIGSAGREFSAEAVTLLASIADQVGIAVENAQLYEQTEALAVAEERQRLAREIHDTLAQGFTGINIQLEAVESALETQQQEIALERLSRARHLANQSLAEARRSVWALRSRSLEEKNLADALRDSARGLIAESGLTLTVEVQDDFPHIPLELETDLLRVTQEAVMNVVKHAEAQYVAIHLNYQANQIELQIKDDGRGFLVDLAKSDRRDGSGFGLTAMQERIARHGGTLQMDSRPQRGTNIIAKVEFQHKGA